MLRKWWQTLRSRRWALALAVLAAVFYFVGYCGFDQFYLAWICLVPVLWALDDESLTFKEALLVAWVFGLATHMGGYTWIIGMLVKFAYLPLPLALLGYTLLCFAQGSLLAAWGVAVNRLVMRLGVPILWAAPVVMVLAEWLFPALFPSFLSNSQYEQIWFIQTLDLWGPLGLTFILCLASSVLYCTLAARFSGRGSFPTVGWAVLLVLVGGSVVYGFGAVATSDDAVAHAERKLKVGIVQTNMGIYAKTANPREGLRRHREQSLEVERQGAELIVWPESGFYYPIRTGVKNLKRRVLGPVSTPLIFGGMRVATENGERQLYNTAFLTDGDGNLLGTYDKIFLLAFGEYLPLGDLFPFLYDLSPHSSHFYRGTHTRPLVHDGIKYGLLVCYEDILTGFVRKVMEHEPDILVNVTNDSWFGDTREPAIHLAMAAYRAVEYRRFLIRSTNTGISAIVDPTGRILDQTPVFARANLVGEVAMLSGTTIYATLGPWVGVLCGLGFLWWIRLPLYRFGSGLTRRGRRDTKKGDATPGKDRKKKLKQKKR